MPPSESPKTFFDEIQKCPQNAGNAVSETHISKWDFKPIYFAQKCPQNTRNTVSETQISKNFRGGIPLDPPTIVSSLWPPPPGYATAYSL